MTPRTCLLLVALLALPLAGCAGPGPGMAGGPGHESGPGGYVCGNPQAFATWTEPGAGALLLEGARAAGYQIVPMEPEPAPLAFRHEDLDARGSPYELTGLRWVAPSGMRVSMSSLAPGELEVMVMGPIGHPDTTLAFVQFLEQIGLDGSPERPAWERAFDDAPDGAWPPRVVLVAEPDLTTLYERLRPTLVERAPGIGGFQLWDAEWELRFRIPAWGIMLDGFRIYGDLADQFSAAGTIPIDTEPRLALETRVRDAFQKMGIPPPTFQDAITDSTPC